MTSTAGDGRRTAVCTICSCNYVAQARVLMDSLAEVHPEWDRHVLIVDEVDGRFDAARENFEVTEIAELPIPDLGAFCFQYTILELNTAAKPPFLQWLFDEHGYDRVLYIDPDIAFYSRMDAVEEALDDGALMCLTPHLTAPLPDEKKPSEVDILRAGSHNLGFIALARHPELMRFLGWWTEKTREHCVVDFAANLFVDQRWIDLAPGMFPDVRLIRHPGYNIAYWNLPHREIEKRAPGDFRVNGERLVFFHYSGLNPLDPGPFSKHQERFSLRTLGAARELVDGYIERVLKHGYRECREWRYAFGQLHDGTQVPDIVRSMFRKDRTVRRDAGQDPLSLGADYFNEAWGRPRPDRPLVTRLMHFIWSERPDLILHYPDPTGSHRAAFAYWFAHHSAIEIKLADAFIAPTRASLSARDSRPSWRTRIALALRRIRPYFGPLVKWIPEAAKQPIYRLLAPPPITQRITSEPGQRRGDLGGSGGSGGFAVTQSGFYPMGDGDRADGCAWMGPSSEIRLPEAHSSEASTLCIEGVLHQASIEAATGSPTLAISVELDDVALDGLKLAEGGEFRASLGLGSSVEAGALLRLKARQIFVPAEIGQGEDPRELSIQVRRVWLGDTIVLDFGSDGDPYKVRWKDGDLPGINIVGYVRSELGVGESSRLCAAAADAASIPFTLVDFNLGCSSRMSDDRWDENVSNDNPYPVNIVHVNADQLPLLHQDLGRDFFRDKYNIGVWHWELPEFPNQWLSNFNLLDEVWAPTRFVMEAVSDKSPLPTVLMPHAITFDVPHEPSRRSFELPESKFLFLAMYDMHSFQERKNPEAAIQAFLRAFPDPDSAGVGLVIKVMNPEPYSDEFGLLRSRLSSIPGTHLISETLTRARVYELEAACDAFVSLHRSEGFGLGLAESMYLEKPVIATNWSGNTDFMRTDNSCPVDFELIELAEDYGPYRKGQLWADPDIDHAAHFMRALVEDIQFRKSIAAAGRQTMLKRHSPAVVGARYADRLRLVAGML